MFTVQPWPFCKDQKNNNGKVIDLIVCDGQRCDSRVCLCKKMEGKGRFFKSTENTHFHWG